MIQFEAFEDRLRELTNEADKLRRALEALGLDGGQAAPHGHGQAPRRLQARGLPLGFASVARDARKRSWAPNQPAGERRVGAAGACIALVRPKALGCRRALAETR